MINSASIGPAPIHKPKVLFLVEGSTDIRFVAGLSEICELTMMLPERSYGESLRDRIRSNGCHLSVEEIPGGRFSFQWRSLLRLSRVAHRFDLILAQESLRGALNANLIGRLRRIPVITYVGIPPIEYFRCRRERRQIGPIRAAAGEGLIRILLLINGKMATKCLAMGPYLRAIASRYSESTDIGLYYGVDTNRFRPVYDSEKLELRRKLNLPEDKFLVFFSSRVTHEKDPETVLKAVSLARSRGLDAMLLNLGGGYHDFLGIARATFADAGQWVIARPAAHPISEVPDYLRSMDALAQASLAEGGAYSTLEALACAVPVVATAVGGMAVNLKGHARLVERRDSAAMADELLWIANNPGAARAQAMQGREYVIREWNKEKAFSDLRAVLLGVCRRSAIQPQICESDRCSI